MVDEIVRVFALAVLLAGVETLHGIARAALLVPRIGKRNALKVAIVTGSCLAFAVCWWQVPGIGISGTPALLALGGFLAVFMASFDIALARLLLKLPWRKVLADFDPRSGNYLSVGLLLLATFPWLVMALR